MLNENYLGSKNSVGGRGNRAALYIMSGTKETFDSLGCSGYNNGELRKFSQGMIGVGLIRDTSSSYQRTAPNI